jgi:hypothetical protein
VSLAFLFQLFSFVGFSCSVRVLFRSSVYVFELNLSLLSWVQLYVCVFSFLYVVDSAVLFVLGSALLFVLGLAVLLVV